jgi:hypothetical protein
MYGVGASRPVVAHCGAPRCKKIALTTVEKWKECDGLSRASIRLCLAFVDVKQIRRNSPMTRRHRHRVHRVSRVNPPICIGGSGGVRVAPTAAPEDC